MAYYLQDPGFYWLIWGIATVIGVLVGWLLRAALPEREIARALERSEQERNALARLFAQIRDQHELREADLKRATLELSQLRKEASTYQLEKAGHAAALAAAQARLEKVLADIQHHAEKARLLEEQLAHLRLRNEALTTELAHLHDELNSWRVLSRDFAAMQRQIQTLQGASATLEAERDHLRQQLQNARLDIENLQRDILRRAAQPNGHFNSAPNGEHYSGPSIQQAGVPADADDLTAIQGISPQAERQLHALGIYNFHQISRWDNASIAAIAKVIGVAPLRIVQENWVGQAQYLVAGYQN